MFSHIKSFFYRHRRKFITSGIVVGGAVLAYKYGQRKLIEWQEKEAKDFLNRTHKQHHFQSTEKNCNLTIASLAVPLKEEILKTVNTEELLTQLRNGSTNRVGIWEELKVLAFTQYSALLYSGLMIVILLRVQLNLLGGYIFLDTTQGNDQFVVDSKSKEIYLSLCEHFIKNGVKEVCALIEKHVRVILKDSPLKKNMSLRDIENIFWTIQTSIFNDPQDPFKNLPKYLLIPLDTSNTNIEKLNKMYTETVEVLNSEEVKSLAESSLSRSYANTLDHITVYFVPKDVVAVPSGSRTVEESSPSTTSAFPNVNTVTIPMAKIIPIINGLGKELGINGGCEPWIQQFILMDKIERFGANIYEAFSHSSN